MSAAMYQVAIIGAGQLGRRHLEGLVKSVNPISIYVVDPNELSRCAVEEYIASTTAGLIPNIKVYETVAELPSMLDLAIVATTSTQRLKAIEQLLCASKVRHLILEKFLFNDTDHYATAENLILNHGATAWVNTPRRHFNIYQELRKRNRDNKLLQFTVDGGDWGLCCNSVHFVDLAQFLTASTELEIIQTRFDDIVVKSKREGYVELTGEIVGNVGSTTLIVRSISGSTKPILIILHYDHQTILIDESASTLWYIRPGSVEKEVFNLPYQSEMTGTIADQLLMTATCDLTPYAESAAVHRTLLCTFADKAGIVNNSRAQCAIT